MNWRLLLELYKKGIKIPGILLKFLDGYDTVRYPTYYVEEIIKDDETLKEYKFVMLRLLMSGRKITYYDYLGLVGLNSLDMSQNCCILTEGVSDFMSLKLMVMSLYEAEVRDKDIQTTGSNISEIIKDRIESVRFKQGGTRRICTNVLGVTRLSGDSNARKLLCSLFDNYIIMTDSDKTGISNANNFRQRLVNHGKRVKIILPTLGCKDISDEFVETHKYYYD